MAWRALSARRCAAMESLVSVSVGAMVVVLVVLVAAEVRVGRDGGGKGSVEYLKP